MKIIITEEQRDSLLNYRELAAFKQYASDSYKVFANAMNRLKNKHGNQFTDFTDIDENLKIKFFNPESRGIEVYMDIDNLGESEKPFKWVYNPLGYDDEHAELYETRDNKKKYWEVYIDENGDKQPSYKSLIKKRLFDLRSILGINDMSIHVFP